MNHKKVAILQPNYIPWKGYFDMINSVDEFILLDDVQYTRSDWRNRNLIKTYDGLKWLIIPVHGRKESYLPISEVTVADPRWNRKHWTSIAYNYSKAPYFKNYRELFEDLYLNNQNKFLSFINFTFISAITNLLGINTKITWSGDYTVIEGKNERVLSLCKQAGAHEYVTGPAARSYLDEALFAKENVKVSWMDYSNYPPYHQLHSSFEHGVSIIDLIFNEGTNARNFMKSFNSPV